MREALHSRALLIFSPTASMPSLTHLARVSRFLFHAFHVLHNFVAYGSDGKSFSLVALSELKMHKNALAAGAAPRRA